MDEVEIRWTPGLKTPAQDGTAADEPHFLIRTLAAEFSNGRKVEPHSHPWGQSIYAISGVMSVWTTEGSLGCASALGRVGSGRCAAWHPFHGRLHDLIMTCDQRMLTFAKAKAAVY